MHARLHAAGHRAEDLADLAAGQLLDMPQDDRRAVIAGQLVECGGQDGPPLAPERWIVEASRRVGDRLARLALCIDDPLPLAAVPAPPDPAGGIGDDPTEP